MRDCKSVDDLYVFREWSKKPVSYLAFLTAFITGILANGFAISNGYVSGDGLVYGFYYRVTGWDISQGRWGLLVFDNRFVTCWFEGLAACCVIALAAVFIVKIFEIESTSIIVAISMLISTQVHFAHWQGLTYVLLPYATAFLCAVLSVWLCGMRGKCQRVAFVAAVISLTFSVSIYQAYLPVAIILILVQVIIYLIARKNIRYICLKLLRYLSMGILSGILYFCGLKISLQYYGVQMTEARGWSNAMTGRLPILSGFVSTIKSAYGLFMQLVFVDGVHDFSKYHKLVYIIFFLIVLYLVIFGVFKENKKDYIRNILIVLLLLFCPLGIVLLRLITETVVTESMFPAVIFVPIGLLVLLDKLKKVVNKGNIAHWGGYCAV